MSNQKTVDSHYKWGDIELSASTGLIFRPHKQYLAEYSTVFKEMLEVIETPKIAPEAAIEMGLTPELLRLFLDLFSAHNPVELNTTFSETKILFTACEKFDCHDKVMGPIRDILYSQGEQQLWELLTWAAERDDRKMGAWALGRMSAVIFLQGRNQFGFFVGLKRSLETLPYSWRSEILYIALEIDHPAQAVVDRKDLYTWRSRSKNVYTGTRIRQKEERVCPFREDWSQVASAFEAGPPH